MGILEKIAEIEREISRTQKNKATEYHLGLLKAKLAKYRQQLLEPTGKSAGKGEGFDVMKSGDARVALIGFPSVGKSTLLSTLTSTKSECAAYEFTTLTCIPGVIEYNGAKIQLLDLPGIIEGAAQGKGRGRQVIAVARTADLVVMMLDATKSKIQKELLTAELESVGIRLNKRKPNIYFKQKKGGGISFNSTLPLTKCNEKMVQLILHEWKIFNAEVLFREDCTSDEFVDVILGSRVYMPCLYVYNKIDQISIEEIDRIAREPSSVVVSCNMRLNLDYLLEMVWEYLALVRVYTKKRGAKPDFEDGLILRRGCTAEHVCHVIHRTMVDNFKYGLVWGTSVKYSPQRIGLQHLMNHDDVIQIERADGLTCDFQDFVEMNTDPLAIVVVTSGTRGDRLLFRYPSTEPTNHGVFEKSKGSNPYAVKVTEDINVKKEPVTSCIRDNTLVGFSDSILANILAVKQDLCRKPFDLKIDDVRFVGYPMSLDPSKSKPGAHQIISFNITFVLRANVTSSVIQCYTDLVKQITVAIHHEEERCQYLSSQAKIMLAVHDEVAAMPEDSVESPYAAILQKCTLASCLQTIFEDLGRTGLVHLFINKWIEIWFCLPHKIHQIPDSSAVLKIEPEIIQKCLECLRPYHGVLLLEEKQVLQDSLPMDCSPALSRLITVCSPQQSLQVLSQEADLTLSQVFHIVGHLVYWGKATIIYPLCETNVYVLSPVANTYTNSDLSEQFKKLFNLSLCGQLAEFSYPVKLRESKDVLNPIKQQDQKVKIVLWMLQHQLLIQLHTYVIFCPPASRRMKKMSEEMCRSSGMPIVPEEECVSVSDIASVNSDESLALSYQGTSQFSKSPSSDGSLASEDRFLSLHEELYNLSKEERDCILDIPAARTLEDLKLFTRLFPYFRGDHHLEEIMYYENLHRSDLMALLDKFRSVLITCQYEDPATSFTHMDHHQNT
ncbi:GATOR complex protein NPRL3-like [Crassostrea angulata]|uniref:GATOR complex protein NPRL3-like n=1 Tax=Magallana angulata TaxID=2784310 RepID=UPI0022B08D90|nr:GATOR complex protein NPRL3-like [Crassostrea angulata]